MDSLVYTGGRLMRGCLYGVSWDLGFGIWDLLWRREVSES